MKKQTRSPQEILAGIKLGDTYLPDKFTSFKWGRWPIDSEDGKYAIIMTIREVDGDNYHKHESKPLDKMEALAKISEFVFQQD